MRPTASLHALRRFAKRIGPLLLCAALAACGGGVAIGFGYYDDDDHDHPDHPPPVTKPASS